MCTLMLIFSWGLSLQTVYPWFSCNHRETCGDSRYEWAIGVGVISAFLSLLRLVVLKAVSTGMDHRVCLRDMPLAHATSLITKQAAWSNSVPLCLMTYMHRLMPSSPACWFFCGRLVLHTTPARKVPFQIQKMGTSARGLRLCQWRIMPYKRSPTWYDWPLKRHCCQRSTLTPLRHLFAV
jgi:hypothetical protein